LHEVEPKLMEGSAREDGLRRGGSTAASSSPAFGRSRGAVLGLGLRKWRKNEGNGLRGFL